MPNASTHPILRVEGGMSKLAAGERRHLVATTWRRFPWPGHPQGQVWRGTGPCSPVIVHVVHSLVRGGTERTLVSLLRRLDPARGRHGVVTLRRAGPLAAHLPDHVCCRPINVVGRSRTACLRLAGVTREWRAAVIHARNTGCWYDATIAGLLTPGAQLVLGFHGLESGQWFNRRQRRLARFGHWAGARFTSVSEAGKRQLCEQAGIPAARVDVLRNGLDMRPFIALDGAVRWGTRRRFQFDDAAFVVGIVGSFIPVKQHALLIQAVARAVRRIPTIRLMMVGNGPLRTALGARARTAGIADRVCFTGSRDDVPAMLAGMDAYICCSESEGMSNALLEAMAAGLPIVATDVGDHGIVLRNRIEGLLVPPGSAHAICDALGLLAESPTLRRRLGSAARTRVNDYAFDQTVVSYERYYQTLREAGALRCARGRSPDGSSRPPHAARTASVGVAGRR